MVFPKIIGITEVAIVDAPTVCTEIGYQTALSNQADAMDNRSTV